MIILPDSTRAFLHMKRVRTEILKPPSLLSTRHLGIRSSELTHLNQRKWRQFLPSLWPWLVHVCKCNILCLLSSEPSLPPCPLASLCSSVTRNQWKETWARCANTRANCRHHHHNSARNCAKISSEVIFLAMKHIYHLEFLKGPKGATNNIVGVTDDLLILWTGQMGWKYTDKCPECHTSWQKCDNVVTIVTWSAPINGRSEDMWTG